MSVTIDPTGGLGQAEMLRRLAAVAEQAATRMYPGQSFSLEHINQSENTTYLVRAGDERVILRIHRTGYHSDAAIRSEHLWLQALREEAGVRTPAVLPVDGASITHIVTDELPEGRNCVFFEFLEGVEPDPDDLLANFPNLGEVTAKMHAHVLEWTLPAGFERFHWNLDTIFGAHPHWGHWQDCVHVDEAARALLEKLTAVLKRRLAAFGTSPERYGLVHADMRLANLLLHEGETRVIDFDDCGFSWLLYDLATSVGFEKGGADIEALVDAWLSGYRRVRSLSEEELAEIPSFNLLRRLLIIAWCGSHAETELAAELGPEFVAETCAQAERYLAAKG